MAIQGQAFTIIVKLLRGKKAYTSVIWRVKNP